MSDDCGRVLSATVLRRQIAAMPSRLYEVRLIHSGSRQPYPGVRRWTASRMLNPATVRFLRIRNREDYDVYFRPTQTTPMPVTSCWISTRRDHRAPPASSPACGHTVMSRASWWRPVRDVCRPGFE
jgi:hypothetical protein